MQKLDVVTKNSSNRSINSPKGGASSVKSSHWRHVKDSLSKLWSPGKSNRISEKLFLFNPA